MNEVFIVWHYTAYNEKHIEAVFFDEQLAQSLCNEHAKETVPGYCNYGYEPAYCYTYEPAYNTMNEYKKEKEKADEEFQHFMQATDAYLWLKEQIGD